LPGQGFLTPEDLSDSSAPAVAAVNEPLSHVGDPSRISSLPNNLGNNSPNNEASDGESEEADEAKELLVFAQRPFPNGAGVGSETRSIKEIEKCTGLLTTVEAGSVPPTTVTATATSSLSTTTSTSGTSSGLSSSGPSTSSVEQGGRPSGLGCPGRHRLASFKVCLLASPRDGCAWLRADNIYV
jgi:hypothetical protein